MKGQPQAVANRSEIYGPLSLTARPYVSFAQHLCDDKDQDGAAEPSSEKKIQQRVSDGSQHWCECEHTHLRSFIAPMRSVRFVPPRYCRIRLRVFQSAKRRSFVGKSS